MPPRSVAREYLLTQAFYLEVKWIVSIAQLLRMTDAPANYLLGKGGYVFGSVGLSVCLSVDNITQKVMNGLG